MLASKRRVGVAILLFLQALLFGYYVAFMVDSAQDVASIEVGFLTVACAVVLGIFAWRGSLIAVIVSMIVSVIEIMLAAALTFLFLLWGPTALLYLLAVPAPLVAPGVLALPTLILCMTVLAAGRSARPIQAIPPAGPPAA